MSRDWSEFSHYVQTLLQKGSVPGAQICVRDSSGIIYSESFGYRDEAKTKPVNEDTIFGIASMSKSVTSAAAALLEAEGKLKKEYKESPKAAAVYRYFDYEVCPKHLHLKCTECGDVSHLSVEATKEIVKIIGKDFVLNKEQTTLLGICSNCKKG